MLKTGTISLLEFATEYLDFVEEKYSTKTYKEKKRAFKELFKSFDSNITVDAISKGDVLKHLRKQFKNRSGNSANKDRKNFIAAWNWGIKYMSSFPKENPFFIDRFPETRHPRYIPPREDLFKVIEVAESFQDETLLYCYLHLAARKTELFRLTWADISFEERKIRLYTRKRKDGSIEYDWLPLTKLIQDKLELLADQRGDDQCLVFPNPKNGKMYGERLRWMKRLCEKAEVKRFGLHAIRHLSASILIENDVPLIDIKSILRHKSLNTTERYIHRLKSLRISMNVFENEKPSCGAFQNKKAPSEKR